MTGRAPAVSVLMTACNREAFVAPAIESVLVQRFTDLELVIVDDASADGTAAIAEAYAARDSRVRVVRNRVNLGDYPNRNHAATLARGRFLRYHDAGDVMYPHCLEVLVRLLDGEPRAACAISTSRGWPGGAAPMLLSPRQAYQREFLGYGLFMAGPGSALFRTDWFRAAGGFPESGPGSGYRFWLQACARSHVLLAPADLSWHRAHAGQERVGPDARRTCASLAGAVWAALASDACPLDPREREQARVSAAWTVARRAWRDLRTGRAAEAWHGVRESGLSAADWGRYLRRPRRSALAGTPLDADGEYLVPAWLRPGAARRRPA
ncbi:MAG: glycosyltransferase family 2 protein [Vicinamibacterales bacterium]